MEDSQIRKCLYCGSEIKNKKKSAKYCSDRCRLTQWMLSKGVTLKYVPVDLTYEQIKANGFCIKKIKQEIRDAEMRRRTKAYLARNPEYLPKLKALIKKNKKIYPNSSFDLAFRMMRAEGWHLGNNFIKHVEIELNELTL